MSDERAVSIGEIKYFYAVCAGIHFSAGLMFTNGFFNITFMDYFV